MNIRRILISLVLLVLIGCVTAPAYKTLYAVEKSTDFVVKGYFDLVIEGKVRTNDVPRIAKMYDRFQQAMRLAEKAAEFSPTAKANTNILALSEVMISETLKAQVSQ